MILHRVFRERPDLQPRLHLHMVAENEGCATTVRQIREIGIDGALGDISLVVLTAAGPVEDQPRPASMTLDEAREDFALRHPSTS